MKNNNDIIGNRTRDLPACSAMPQPTALCGQSAGCFNVFIALYETTQAQKKQLLKEDSTTLTSHTCSSFVSF
jgi:hypothetical protein